MGMNPGDRQSPNWLALWWGRRFEYRQQIELAVIDMYDRYGAAAYGIARNSARARGGAEHRRFWGLVARRGRRHAVCPSGLLIGGHAASIPFFLPLRQQAFFPPPRVFVRGIS